VIGFISVLGAFFGLGKLQLLDVSDNRLHRLDNGTFYGLGALDELYVRRNQLVGVARRALAPVAGVLTHLDLSGNRLQTIDLQTLATVDRLTVVDLASNPWTCDCRLWRSSGSETLKAPLDHIVCEFPPTARGKFLLSVCVDGLSPSTEQPTLSPPVDFIDDDRWSKLWITVTVLVVLCMAVISGTIVTACESRQRSGVWAPCGDVEGHAAGTSETSISDDGNRKVDDVVETASETTAGTTGIKR